MAKAEKEERPYAVVYRAMTLLDANLREAVLAAANIPCLVLSTSDGFHVGRHGYMGDKPLAKVVVPRPLARVARRVLADYEAELEAGAFALPDDPEE